MLIELKRELISPAFVIGSGTLTRALVSSVVQPVAISNAKNRTQVKFEDSFVFTKKRAHTQPRVTPTAILFNGQYPQ